MKDNLILMSAQLGSIQTNCYILEHKYKKEAVVIDPAAEPEVIADILKEKDLKLSAIMLTHGHVDHMGALEGLRKIYGDHIRVFASAPEQEVLMVADYNLTAWEGEPYTTHANVMFREKKTDYEVLGEKMIVYQTPGHTKGSCSYYFPEYDWLFAGDTLFAGSVGRSDLPTGSERDLLHSLNDVLMTLPDETIVYPGHGPATTIGTERESNPYVRR